MNFNKTSSSRRRFIVNTAAIGSAMLLGVRPSAAQRPPTKRFPLIVFSKPFQEFEPERTADYVAEIGWDGIECPVRPRGQVEPEQVADRLPQYVEAFRRRNLDIHILATSITSLGQPHAETVLRTASKLGIRHIRLGYWRYDLQRNPAAQLEEIAPMLKDIADACAELGLQAGIQNHSGPSFVGGPIWDVFPMIRDLDSKHVGMCFDIGHAVVEGGLSWPLEARLMAPYYTAVFVKDFVWRKMDAGWRLEWCELGQGMVNRSFFERLKQSDFAGPISQHYEYPLGDAKQMAAYFRKDLAVLKAWLA